MNTVDTVDHHVRFNAEWDGHKRFVFIPIGYVEADAGCELSRAEAVAFVSDHLDRYRREAQVMSGRKDSDQGKIVMVERTL